MLGFLLFGVDDGDALSWKDLLNNGVLLVVLVGFAGGVWKVLVWGRDHVATPIVQAHLGLINELRHALPKHTDSLERAANALEEQTTTLHEIKDTSGEHLALQKREMDYLEEIKTAAKEQAALARDNVDRKSVV